MTSTATDRDAGDAFDRHSLYERFVQDAPGLIALLHAIHGGDGLNAPIVLGEDCCGTALLSRAWVAASGSVPESGGPRRAVAVDHDPDLVERARSSAEAERVGDRIHFVSGDVITGTHADPHDDVRRIDVLHCGNFSIGSWHDRAALVSYLRHARSRLAPGGVFVCDLYGGPSAFDVGITEQSHPDADLADIVYEWEQRTANPLTGRVVNAIHFSRRDDDGAERARLDDAFVYDWRLWSVPELRDAMVEAGFSDVQVHARLPDATDGDGRAFTRPINDDDAPEGDFDLLVVARRDRR